LEKLNVAILLVFSKRVSVTDNTVKTCLAHGIQFWGNWQNTIQSEDLIFSGNHVRDGGAGALWGSGARRVIVSGNIVDGCRDVGLDLEMCDDSVISGNTVRRPEVAGISLFVACNNVSITGNTVINDRPFPPEAANANWWVRAGIWLTAPNRETFPNDRGHRNIAIVGNTIHCLGDLPRRAIWVGSEAKNVRIESNAISGGEIYYGGHHQVTPLMLETLKQPVSLNDRPTPDKPRF
jgi:parallel beta-helix repeat protein